MSKRAVRLTPAEISSKWERRLGGAIGDIQRGIDGVTENPMAKAAEKADKWAQNVAASKAVWAKNVGRVTLQEWKQKTRQKVAERMAGGIAAAKDKRQKFDTYMVSTLNTILPQIDAMPNMNLQDSINRMTKFVTEMANNRYKDRS